MAVDGREQSGMEEGAVGGQPEPAPISGPPAADGSRRKVQRSCLCCLCCWIYVAPIATIATLLLVATPAAVCAYQVRQKSYAKTVGTKLEENGTSPEINLDQMSALPDPSLYETLREDLHDAWKHLESGYTFGLAGVHEAPMLLYNGTKVDGIWENVPDAVKGVFWMRGNGLPEILATLQFGEWFPEEKVLVVPNAPFAWTWFAGDTKPNGTSEFTDVYNHIDAFDLAHSQGEANISVAVSFDTCPKGAQCVEGSDNYTFAHIQSHDDGNLMEPSLMTAAVTWTMEEDPSAVVPHSLWYRRVSVYCGKIEAGSYWLTKIIDANGERIEPYYSDYVEFMEGNDHIIWSGFGEGHHLV